MKLSITRIILSLLLAVALQSHAADADFHIADQQVLPGNARWDYLNYDPGSQRLFITRGDHVDVYDTSLKQVVGTISDTQGVHGVALAPDLGLGFTSNGRTNSVTVFELSSLKEIATLPTEQNPDAIIYDAFSKRVFAANGKSGSLTAIDAVNKKVVSHIQIGGKLETASVDGKGLLYVNVEDKNQLAVVDTNKLSVLTRYDLSVNCDEPAGLSIDVAKERLFVGCHNQKLLVVSTKTGETLAKPAIGKGSDAVGYDRELDLVFSSNSDGTLTIISANDYTVKQNLLTKPRARTLALDSINHTVYTVTADVDDKAPKQANGRPQLKEGTFTLLTITR